MVNHANKRQFETAKTNARVEVAGTGCRKREGGDNGKTGFDEEMDD